MFLTAYHVRLHLYKMLNWYLRGYTCINKFMPIMFSYPYLYHLVESISNVFLSLPVSFGRVHIHFFPILTCIIWSSPYPIFFLSLPVSFGRVHIQFFPILTCINWSSPYPIFNVFWGGIFHIYSNFKRNFCKQIVENLIRRRVLWRLIWFCIVC